jgi:hypothetical protein
MPVFLLNKCLLLIYKEFIIMAVSYNIKKIGRARNDGLNQIIREAEEAFKEKNINILGGGIAEVFTDDSIFEDYKVSMLAGCNESDSSNLNELFDNIRYTVVNEALDGIAPISSLSVPAIRRLWPKMALTNAIPTEVVKLPRFNVSYIKPFLKDGAGTKHYLPEALLPGGSGETLVEGVAVWPHIIRIADVSSATDVVDINGDQVFDTDGNAIAAYTGLAKGANLSTLSGYATTETLTADDTIDPDFVITHAVVNTQNTVGVAGGYQEQIVPIKFNYVQSGAVSGITMNVEWYDERDLDAAGKPLAGAVLKSDTIFGSLDRTNCILSLVSRAHATYVGTPTTNSVVGIVVKGRFSQERNERGESVGFDIEGRDIQITAGDHINAPLPIEFLQDTLAMYNIDGAVKVVDIMTNVFALKLEREMAAFITNAWNRMPRYEATFDCQPSLGFAGTPRDWRIMLQDVIEHQAISLKQDMFYTGGKFVIVGNELDIKLIPNIQWVFTSAGNERSGVEVDYMLGAIGAGSIQFDIVATPHLTAGTVYVFFVSNEDEMMTYKYFPYAFSIEKGYLDPNNLTQPSIMMSRRHKLEYFVDAIIKINILNNDGEFMFDGSGS